MALEIIDGKIIETIVTEVFNEKVTRVTTKDAQNALAEISMDISSRQKQLKSLQVELDACIAAQTQIINLIGE